MRTLISLLAIVGLASSLAGALLAQEIVKIETPHVDLHTDCKLADAELTALIEVHYGSLLGYFEKVTADLPRDFRVTGCLMKDVRAFREVKLLDDDVPLFHHGRHLGRKFWVHEQATPYYSRHLLLHEATHCFMLSQPVADVRVRPGLWYLEGMAEMFATHQLSTRGRWRVGVMPAAAEAVPGWGRIETVRRDVREGRRLSISEIIGLPEAAFNEPKPSPYAWSWALCTFLTQHTRYRDRFEELGEHLADGTFQAELEAAFSKDRRLLDLEWEQFCSHLCYGYDVSSAVIHLTDSRNPQVGESLDASVAANKGWQPAGITVQAGATYRLQPHGQVTLAMQPKPWISEPRGISVRYAEGRPIGRLLVAVLKTEFEGGQPSGLDDLHDADGEITLRAQTDGELFLRVNDFWNELEDNTGEFEVAVERIQ